MLSLFYKTHRRFVSRLPPGSVNHESAFLINGTKFCAIEGGLDQVRITAWIGDDVIFEHAIFCEIVCQMDSLMNIPVPQVSGFGI